MKPQPRSLKLEALEDRTLLSTCHVTRLSDTGIGGPRRNTGDLRYCINMVNAMPGPDVIEFHVTGRILLNNALPELASVIDILGPGADQLVVRRNSCGFYSVFSVAPSAKVTIKGLTISNGGGSISFVGFGGGIYNEGDLTVDGCSIVANRISGNSNNTGSSTRGGGIYSTGTLFVRNSLIAENTLSAVSTAPGGAGLARGGGIANDGGLLVIDNSTITSNSAFANGTNNPVSHARGGGVYSDATITHTTIANNATSGDNPAGGGVFSVSSSLVSNTIVALNTSTNVTGGFSGGSNFINGDPMLGPLANNGGPTLTMALLPGSPAIDAGDNTDAPEFDQRGPGFPRIVNGTIDIGAFEVQATGVPSQPRFLAFLITADIDRDRQETIR